MKPQKLVLIFSIVLGILFMTYFYSCRKEEKNTSQQSLLTIRVDKKNYDCENISLRDKKNNAKDIGENYTVKNMTVNFSQSGMQTLFNDIKNHFSGDIQNTVSLPEIVILYANDSLTNIHFDSVKAITFFTNNNGELLQKFYKVIGSSTQEDTTLRKTCNYFYLYDIDFLTEIKFTNNKVGWALFQKNTTTGPPLTYNDYNNFGKKVFELSSRAPIIDCRYCNGDSHHTCKDGGPGNGQVCDNGGEVIVATNNYAKEYNLILSNDSLIDLDNAYDFRDNFLVNTTKGKKYIDYYYQLSIVVQLYKTIKVANFFQHLTLAYEIVDCANKLQKGRSTDIPISTKFKNDAINLLDTYKNIAPNNTNYQAILTQIETDLTDYCGQSRAYILSHIE